MLADFFEQHWLDENGNPAGGVSSARGIGISWQNGPLGRGEKRIDPNGAFVETVIAIAKGRIDFYQSGKFACKENADAIHHLELALDSLNQRTQRREKQKIEGTHAGN